MGSLSELQQRRKQLIHSLLKGIETGDPSSVEVLHPQTYIQHNPQTQTGRAGLAALFERLSKTSPRVNLVRTFADGDYVFAHTEYDFATRRIGFEVFRFEGELTVEHWDNIQPRRGPNASGHSMVDGPNEVDDVEKTESTRALVREFIETVFVGGQPDRLDGYISEGRLVQHSPALTDGGNALRAELERTHEGRPGRVYERLHRVLAQGNFALAVSEGTLDGVHTAFYDLYRVSEGKLVEHWDTVETVAPKSEWKHDNGKF